jgi:aminomethyltransferase
VFACSALSALKRTPLFAAHQRLGGRLIEFGGWEMPVQYTSIMDEHQTVRTAAGLFDISHMGELFVSGPGSAEFLNHLLTNDVRKTSPGQGQYTILCNEQGGVVDDLYLYHLRPDEFLLVVNASRLDEDVAWIERCQAAFPRADEVRVQNASETFGAIALQGPRAKEFIDLCFASTGAEPSSSGPSGLNKNKIAEFRFAECNVLVARTGYTGEDGFEVIPPVTALESIWDGLLAAGQPYGLKPAGLGARDTLRTEACLPLYGHELDGKTTPIEAALGFFVAVDKGEFIGREVLALQKAEGVVRKCVPFKMTGRSAPPRPHYPIWSTGAEEKMVGEVTSGTLSPSLGIGIGLGFVPVELARPGTAIQIEIRGRRQPAEVAARPLHRKAV